MLGFEIGQRKSGFYSERTESQTLKLDGYPSLNEIGAKLIFVKKSLITLRK